MPYTQPRTPEDGGGASLHLARWARSAAVVVLVLSTGEIPHGQIPESWNPRDLLAGEPTEFIERLEAARPAPIPVDAMSAILRALPLEGEVTRLAAPAQQKVDAVRQLLTATRRGWYEIKVIDVPQAAIALHARAVLLMSLPAVALLSAVELQAMVAHEVGHEYVWTEWHRAHQQNDQQRLRELEHVCDGIAAVTLSQLGMNPSNVIDAIEKLTRFNQRRFGEATNEKNYPTVAERRAFARQIQQWLRDSSWRSRSGRARH